MSPVNTNSIVRSPSLLEKNALIILTFAKTLFINGQTTTQVIRETKKIAKVLNLNMILSPSWGQIWLQISNADGQWFECFTETDPVSVHMGKVIATMKTIDSFCQNKITIDQAYEQIEEINKLPPAATWLFSLGAGMGAVALGIIFGLNEWAAGILIFISAALGGMTRRYLATITPNPFAQVLVAAGIAGVIGALAVHFHLSSTSRLVALCPCMVLVPGPHFLNSALDFIHGRMPLGLSRLALASLICTSISLGVWMGMALLQVNLPIDPSPIRVVPLWQDMISAGIAVAAYSIFFSSPLYLMLWPIIVGVIAHMLRWQSLVILKADLSISSFLACLIVGIVMTLVAYNKKMPFASLAFAAVVSMIPGVFLFRMTSGVLTLTSGQNTSFNILNQTIDDGLNAVVIIIAMSIGLLGPKVILDKIIAK